MADEILIMLVVGGMFAAVAQARHIQRLNPFWTACAMAVVGGIGAKLCAYPPPYIVAVTIVVFAGMFIWALNSPRHFPKFYRRWSDVLELSLGGFCILPLFFMLSGAGLGAIIALWQGPVYWLFHGGKRAELAYHFLIGAAVASRLIGGF